MNVVYEPPFVQMIGETSEHTFLLSQIIGMSVGPGAVLYVHTHGHTIQLPGIGDEKGSEIMSQWHEVMERIAREAPTPNNGARASTRPPGLSDGLPDLPKLKEDA